MLSHGLNSASSGEVPVAGFVSTVVNLQIPYKSEFQDGICSMELAVYQTADKKQIQIFFSTLCPIMYAGT
jgi:hypothetical protein